MADVVQALGLALAMIGAMMEGSDIVPPGEFGRKLAILAAVTQETQPGQAAVLERWADIAEQMTIAPKFSA